MSERNPIPPQLSHLEQMRGAMTRAERDLLISVGNGLATLMAKQGSTVFEDRHTGQIVCGWEIMNMLLTKIEAVKAERGAEQQ